MDNWDDFRFVDAVIETGSLNAAARRLGVNHATVLRRIQGFEHRTGVTLFDRARDGYRLAPAHANVAEAIAALKEAVLTAERAMLGRGAAVAGPVRITSTESLCTSILPSLMPGLAAQYPDLDLELIATNQRLDLGKLDAEVTVRPAVELAEGLTGDEVCRMLFLPYGTQAYVDRCKADDAPFDWIGASGNLDRSPPGQWFATEVPKSRRIVRADSFLALRGLAQTGTALAILPCCLVRPEHGLVPVPHAAPDMATRLWVAHHSDLANVPRILAVRAWLAQALSDMATVFEGETPPPGP